MTAGVEGTDIRRGDNRRFILAALIPLAAFVPQWIFWNSVNATFHKFRNKEECGKTLAEYPAFLDVFLPNGVRAPLEQRAVPRALRGETVTNAEYTLHRKDTGDTWAGSYPFAPIRDKGGKIVGSVVTGRDIAARKQAEAALRQKAEALRASNAELEQFSRAMVGRELRMSELKQELNELCRRLGEPPRHETDQFQTGRIPGAGSAPAPPGGGGA